MSAAVFRSCMLPQGLRVEGSGRERQRPPTRPCRPLRGRSPAPRPCRRPRRPWPRVRGRGASGPPAPVSSPPATGRGCGTPPSAAHHPRERRDPRRRPRGRSAGRGVACRRPSMGGRRGSASRCGSARPRRRRGGPGDAPRPLRPRRHGVRRGQGQRRDGVASPRRTGCSAWRPVRARGTSCRRGQQAFQPLVDLAAGTRRDNAVTRSMTSESGAGSRRVDSAHDRPSGVRQLRRSRLRVSPTLVEHLETTSPPPRACRGSTGRAQRHARRARATSRG